MMMMMMLSIDSESDCRSRIDREGPCRAVLSFAAEAYDAAYLFVVVGTRSPVELLSLRALALAVSGWPPRFED